MQQIQIDRVDSTQKGEKMIRIHEIKRYPKNAHRICFRANDPDADVAFLRELLSVESTLRFSEPSNDGPLTCMTVGGLKRSRLFQLLADNQDIELLCKL